MSYKQLMVRFFEREISSEEKEELFRWLNEDFIHIQEFIRERKNYDLELISNRRITAPVDIGKEYEKIREYIKNDKEKQVRKQRTKKRSSWIRLIRHTVSYAAILACCFFIWEQVYFRKDREKIILGKIETIAPADTQSHVAIAPEECKTVQVIKGNKKEIHLPDNTRIWINSQSELKFPEKFEGNTREVWLQGEAYFEVAKDPNRRFIVHTHEFDVKVYGTSFNVFAYKEYSKKSFTLVEGSIKLSSNLALNSPELDLEPGQQAIYDEGQLDVKTVNAKTEVSWKEGKFYFKEKPFREICRQLEHTFNVAIIIKGENLNNSIYTGDFVRNENLTEILAIMSADNRMEYQINGDTIIIKEK